MFTQRVVSGSPQYFYAYVAPLSQVGIHVCDTWLAKYPPEQVYEHIFANGSAYNFWFLGHYATHNLVRLSANVLG